MTNASESNGTTKVANFYHCFYICVCGHHFVLQY